MSSRGGRQKQMMNVVPPITSTQRQQTQQPLQPQQRQQVQQRQPPPPPPLQTQQTQQKQQKQQKPKMTIGDAIGLITIRLGRVEQFLQQLQTDGIDMNSINSTQPNDFMDNGLIQNLVSRLNTIEEYSTNTATNSDTEQRIKNVETDLRETKDLLMKLILKFENFSDDTLPKFEEQQQQITLNLEKIQQESQEQQQQITLNLEKIQQLQQESQEQQQQQITLNLEKIQQESQEQLLNQCTSEEALPTPSNESESVP